MRDLNKAMIALLSGCLCLGLVACQPKPPKKDVLSDLTSLTGALQTYYLENGKNPASITELKLELKHPEDINYDPAKGVVRSKSYPDL